ncbi:MAG: hypothetical protein R8K22_08140 [Mariprofundaceae bacterium]
MVSLHHGCSVKDLLTRGEIIMKYLFMIITTMLMASCTGGAGSMPPTAHASENIINAAPDNVYQAAIGVALDMDLIPSKENEKHRYFKTESKRIKLTSDECDCGSMFGISYMADSRTVTEVELSVRVKPNAGGSEITVKTNIIGYFDQSQNAMTNFMSDKHRDRDNLMDCKSLGGIETKFIQNIKDSIQ